METFSYAPTQALKGLAIVYGVPVTPALIELLEKAYELGCEDTY